MQAHFKKIILICCLAAPLWAAGQFISFETKVQEWSGRYVTTIETHDSCILFMTIHSLFKINNRGKVLWKFESYNRFKEYSENILIDSLPVFFNHIFSYEKEIHIYTHRLNGFSSCFIKLDHNGNVLSDTFYYNTWVFPNPFEQVGKMIDRDNYYFSAGRYYDGLKFNLDSSKSIADKYCIVTFKLQKSTSDLYDYNYHCLLDSNHRIQYLAPLNTQDKGYLYVIHCSPKPPELYMREKQHYLIARADSNGNILSVQDLLPPDKMEGFDLTPGRFNIETFYHTNNLYENYPLKMSNRIPDGIYGVAFVDFSPRDLRNKKRGRYHIYYDSLGEIIKIDQPDGSPKPNSFNTNVEFFGPGTKPRNFTTYYNDKIEPMWTFENAGSSTHRHYETIHTNSNGLLYIFMREFIEPYEFIIRHINNQGWPIGYDPYAWTEEKPIHAWFNAQGNLAMPREMEDWQVSLLNSLGQEVHSGKVNFVGELTLPPNIRPGVYILRFHSPHTGKVYYYKTAKQF